ncbi:MAG: 4Fe-4S dicluster domain-containing protein [Phascolarctobacterium sp.]|nr:4Fe-4S dicluster domain-containing protein [Phascolarctobacterium sp.]
MSVMYKISKENLPRLYAALAAEAKLLLPCVNKAGKVDFAVYSDGAAVALDALLTSRSAKDVFFPQVENLVKFQTEGKNLSIEQILPSEENVIVMGVRACDARSFDILDRVFLKEPVDSYYKARREHTLLIGMGCSAPEETCFCSSFGIDATSPETDVRTWLVEGELYWQAVTAKGEALTSKLSDLLEEAGESKAVEAQAEQTKKILSVLPLANYKFDAKLPSNELKVFKSAVWEKLAPSCLSCCTCTYVCPTCHCYDIRDYQVAEGKTERFRCWDSCMASDFTKMAHGNPRKSRLERFRQRYMHKLVYFPENNEGVFACVGCGRCLAKCPVNLNIVKVAKALEKAEDLQGLEVKQDV